MFMMQLTVSISMQHVQADCYNQDECLTVETKDKEQILCQASSACVKLMMFEGFAL